MNWDRHTLWNAGWPALSAGALGVVLSAIVSPGLLIPMCVAVSAVAGSFLTAAWVHRGQQEAKARLRHPELSGTQNPGGIFGEVTQAAVTLLRQYESELQRLSLSKGELEISGKLQKKQSRRFDAALRSIDQPVVLCDTRDHVLFANGAARQLGSSRAIRLAIRERSATCRSSSRSSNWCMTLAHEPSQLRAARRS